MKRFLCSLGVLACSMWALGVNAQLVGTVVEEVAYFEEDYSDGISTIPAGSHTYRIYVELEDSADFLSGVIAFAPCYPINLSTTTSFFNHPFAEGVFGSGINEDMFGNYPNLQFDSYVTVGPSSYGTVEVVEVWVSPEEPLNDPFFAEGTGSSFQASEGAYWLPNVIPNGHPDENGLILIAQVTTTGELSFQLNLQILDDADPMNMMHYVGNSLECEGFDVIDGSGLGLIYPQIYCSDPSACNYSADADPEQVDNSTCDYISCYGCTDEEFCNYDPTALFDDGSCNYSCLSCSQDSIINLDPNTLQVSPIGYTEEHFILNGTSLVYQLHFQNVGNGTVTDLLIRDTISDYLDLETFQFIESTHDVQTTLDLLTRELVFTIEDIFLADSSLNEATSNGCIMFRFDPVPNLTFGTVIENTAHIFFDDNPAVVTNTTWNTIFTCDQLANMEVSDYELCPDEVITLTSTSDHIEIYNWLVNDEVVGNESVLEWTTSTPGEYLIGLQAINPLCNVTNTFPLVVHPEPVAEITQNGSTLTASEGTGYQWYLNGVEITDANDQSLEITESGAYSVEVTNEYGCSDISDAITVVSVAYAEEDAFSFYPNPVKDVAQLQFQDASTRIVQVISMTGQIVMDAVCNQNTLMIDAQSLAQGTYTLRIVHETKGVQALRFVVE